MRNETASTKVDEYDLVTLIAVEIKKIVDGDTRTHGARITQENIVLDQSMHVMYAKQNGDSFDTIPLIDTRGVHFLRIPTNIAPPMNINGGGSVVTSADRLKWKLAQRARERADEEAKRLLALGIEKCWVETVINDVTLAVHSQLTQGKDVSETFPVTHIPGHLMPDVSKMRRDDTGHFLFALAAIIPVTMAFEFRAGFFSTLIQWLLEFTDHEKRKPPFEMHYDYFISNGMVLNLFISLIDSAENSSVIEMK